MLLIHQKKDQPGKWEVNWMWLPMFLSMNRETVAHVDKMLTEKFKGRDHGDLNLQAEMSHEAIGAITDRHPISGLKEYLGALRGVSLDVAETAE